MNNMISMMILQYLEIKNLFFEKRIPEQKKSWYAFILLGSMKIYRLGQKKYPNINSKADFALRI